MLITWSSNDYYWSVEGRYYQTCTPDLDALGLRFFVYIRFLFYEYLQFCHRIPAYTPLFPKKKGVQM
jgi:hypothetical protein